MKKLLTVSIAAYNMENYIEKTITSLIDERIIDYLEIFIIDDGGTDSTLKIAEKFASLYPKSIYPIHKENGGYGSTVNFSIMHATGKYFKLLDGDDWFDTENLVKLVKKLFSSDSDIIFTDYYNCHPENGRFLVSMQDYKNGEKKAVCDCIIPEGFGMWAITYKTELLIKSRLNLPLHTLYTDRIYSTIPLAYARIIEYLSFPVYCYRLGRDGQSISRESRIKHLEETLSICERLCDFYEEQKKDGNENIKVLLDLISMHYATTLHSFLLLPRSKENLLKIIDYEKLIKDKSQDIFKNVQKKGNTGKLFHLLRITKYKIYRLLKFVPDSKFDFKL